MALTITAGNLRAIAGGRAPLAEKLVDPINRHAAANGIDTPLLMAHFLANGALETAWFSTMVENLNYSSAQRLRQVWPSRFRSLADAQAFVKNPKALANKVYGSRLGNREGTDDGWNFRGSGFYQLTGRENYTKFGRMVGIDIVSRPELAREIDTSVQIAAKFFALRMKAHAAVDDAAAARKALNGGTHGLADVKAALARAKKVLAAERPKVEAPKAGGEPDVDYAVWKKGQVYPDLLEIQKLLRGAGYYLNGDLDGKWGRMTRNAIIAFKADNSLARTDDIDVTFRAALSSADPVTLPPERTQATLETVAPKSPVVQEAVKASVWSKVAGAAGTAVAGGSALVDAAPDAIAKVDPIRKLAPEGWAPSVWIFLTFAIAAGIAFAAWKASRKADNAAEAKVEEYREGARA